MPAAIIKFDDFELDLGRYELRRGGRPLKLEKVPMELLILLAERNGELVTREEIVQRLWGDRVFVDTRQGINTAVRKLRLALKDDPDAPRIVQTVFGKGYRWVAPVVAPLVAPVVAPVVAPDAGQELPAAVSRAADGSAPAAPVPAAPAPAAAAELALPESSPPVSPRLARLLFLVIQAGYLVLYAAAFVYFSNIRRLGLPPLLPWVVLGTGLVGAAVRLYLASAVGLNFAGSGRLFRRIFPGVVVIDGLWAAAPLLLFNRLGEASLLCVAALAFLPFSQRSLMGWSYGRGTGAPAGGAKAGGRAQASAA